MLIAELLNKFFFDVFIQRFHHFNECSGKRMDIELIALDMDGTTLGNNHITISVKNRNAIKNALSNGIIVVPATGRTRSELPISVKRIKNIRFAITSNGAYVIDMKNSKEIYSNLIPAEVALHVLNIIEECRVYAEIYYQGNAFVKKESKSKVLNRHLVYKIPALFFKHNRIDSFIDFITKTGESIEKIQLFPDDNFMKKDLEQKLEGIPLAITTSGLNSIEITNYGANKGSALASLCEYLRIEAAKVLAIGDNFNDFEMLKWAGLAVAVENAEDFIKKSADFVTLRSDQDGVAYAINHFI